MNWVGGSRSRIILKQEKRKQKEYFEKKKLKSKMQLLGVSSSKSSAFNLDLLSLYVVNQVSTKNDKTESVKKPVHHIDITENVKLPARRHNVELPTSPPRTQHMSNLDEIQNRLQQQVLDSRKQHLSEKVKYQHNPGHSSDQDTCIKTHPSHCIFRKSDAEPQELFKPLHRLDYMNSARSNPVIMTSIEPENSEGIKEPLFNVVKETAELKVPWDGSDCSFLTLFEEENQPIHINPSTKHFNPFVNQSGTAIFSVDPDDMNQVTSRTNLYDTREDYPAKRSSIGRQFEGVFTAPGQFSLQLHNASSTSYKKTSGLRKTHLQDYRGGQYCFTPFERKGRPANLEKAETSACHSGEQFNMRLYAQNSSVKKSDSKSVQESAQGQNPLLGFAERITAAQGKEFNFEVNSKLYKMEEDVEATLGSQSPCYSPRQTESCFSSSSDTSEEEDTARTRDYLNAQLLKISGANLGSASASRDPHKTSHTTTKHFQPGAALPGEAANPAQEGIATSSAAEQDKKCHSAPSEGSSSHQALQRQQDTGRATCDAWSQTVTSVRKVEVATQCGPMQVAQVCSCRSSLPAARSPATPTGTAASHRIPSQEVLPVATGSTAAGPAAGPAAACSDEAEYLSLVGRSTLEVLNYIDLIKESAKQ